MNTVLSEDIAQLTAGYDSCVHITLIKPVHTFKLLAYNIISQHHHNASIVYIYFYARPFS